MSDYILYGIPVVTFFIVCLIIYIISMKKSKEETEESLNLIKFLPAVVVSIIAFLIIKYTDSQSEPTMTGNYFD